MGQSRVICGYHWQSDVTAARLVASAIVARLHAEPTFAAQLQRAKTEFNALKNNLASRGSAPYETLPPIR